MRPCAVACVTVFVDRVQSSVRPCAVGINFAVPTVCGRMYERVRACSTMYGSFRAEDLCGDVRPCVTVSERVQAYSWSSSLVKLFFRKTRKVHLL